jgi:DNA-binding beta-propeller fold protein YncE
VVGPTTGPAAVPSAPLATRVAVGERPTDLAAAGGFVYVLAAGAKQVVVVNTDTGAVVRPLALPGLEPGDLRAFLDRSAIVVTDVAKREAVVLAPANDHAVLQRVPTGGVPGALAFSEDNHGLLVGLAGGAGTLLTFEDNRAKAPTSAPRGAAAAGDATPEADFKGGLALFGGPDGFRLVDAAGATKRLADGAGPVAIALADGAPVAALLGDTAGDRVYVADPKAGTATVIPDAGKGPRAIALDPTLGTAYVAMAGSNEVALVDYAAKTLLAKLPVGASPTWIAPAPPVVNEIWVGSEDGTVTVIDGKARKVKGTVPVGAGAHRFTFWGTKGYVSNAGDGSITIVDRTQLR